MTTFEFVVSNGAPQKATTAARSHAVKSGLQRKCAAKETGNIKDSQLVIRQKSTLKGRFRVSAVSTKETQPKPTKNGTDPVLPKGKQESAEKTSSQQDRLLRQKYPNGRVSAETQGYSLVKTPNQSWGDPFGTIPISHTQGVDNLIKYCTWEKYTESQYSLIM